VQFKTTAAGSRNARNRVPRGSYAAGQTVSDVQFTNAQMRLTRIILPAGQSVEITTAATEPALLVALSTITLAMNDGAPITLRLGEEHWVDAGRGQEMTNAGAESMELLRVDFLTPPSDP